MNSEYSSRAVFRRPLTLEEALAERRFSFPSIAAVAENQISIPVIDSGKVLFGNNQIYLYLPANVSFTGNSVFIKGHGDVLFQGNQLDCELGQPRGSKNAWVEGVSIRVVNNLFRERFSKVNGSGGEANLPYTSCKTIGVLNCTMGNQATFCFNIESPVAESHAEAIVNVGNQSIFELVGGSCPNGSTEPDTGRPLDKEVWILTGRITLGEDSIAGVNISVKDTNESTTTGTDGGFTLILPNEEATLVFKYRDVELHLSGVCPKRSGARFVTGRVPAGNNIFVVIKDPRDRILNRTQIENGIFNLEIPNDVNAVMIEFTGIPSMDRSRSLVISLNCSER